MLSEAKQRYAQRAAGDIIEGAMELVDGDQNECTDVLKRIMDVLSTCIALHGTKICETSDLIVDSSGGNEH